MSQSKLKAIAINYRDNYKSNKAPMVSAKAEGADCLEMLRVARRYGVSIKFDDSLAQKIFKTPIDKEVSRDCFLDLARVFLEIDSKKSL